ncbi:mannose-ethanolamine phosphotransferase gpi13 [Exophiala xenobiotica]|uniref:Mannose-ethanolamine phosphotransferase gpi13 n=1 Tax=Vermiconidia calcicola TaxID=1690605 RepID=A0AAV9Q4I6_9PEZI|nr:mannose-ethanolamine phosphotransferase gpi13 [Exophiala xenobiotica]KAK5342083.1 mannose-ethanolamine phosphotransferase gpi13 [Exophiala xenobiotica]KAK5426148.1 mannose-ethanolamine phosphotransferase gpi13 [Exophiala xenobiotica]KAK5533873.1 mannose-ethanolamine phosphotransferase gpi13 [Vermiconidia calcicola]KAK5546424.1 mannose-ethanolamine phosphotransferase gpi13 [Chaetothyriales sp. CCFEE 6169]
MSAQVDPSPHAESSNDGSPAVARPTKATEGRNRQKVVAFKVSHVLLSVFFLWLTIVHVIGILFFAKGFLLTRLVLDNKSECAVLPDGQQSKETNGCWHPKTFDRAVIIIIDALRYDFTVPSPGKRFHDEPQQKFYLDNLPILHDTAVAQPDHAFLLPFIADPPTSTLQRLKGLTTGTLPVFIDIGSNFAGTAIEEDNILSQMKNAGKTIVHLGDDTWHALFPGYFDPNMTKPYDSFNVWDLHTVDNGVIEHIMPLLDQSPPRWDVLFGHFLGVDHAGHRYGPEHQAMAEKLRQMNGVIEQIMKRLGDDTLLVIMGDHGMDAKGDHGGESDDEVEAALWMYSKKPRFGRTHRDALTPPWTAKERPVGQIDLVSTLSILLGLPIPFNNLGKPIAEAFAGPGRANWKNLVRVEHLAQTQIARYQEHYSQSRDLGLDDDVYQDQTMHMRRSREAAANGHWEDAYGAHIDWHKEVIGMYRKLWANFSLADMLYGVIISGLALGFLLFFARFSKGDKSVVATSLLRSAGLGTAAGVAVGPVLGVVLPTYFTAVAGLVFGATVGGVITAGVWCYQNRVAKKFHSPSAWGWMAFAFVISQSAGFASNSYTIHEDTILLFFLTTFGIVSMMSSLRQAYQADRVLGVYQSVLFILLARLASFSRLCREEQMPGCRSTFYASSTSSTSAPWQLLIPYSVALILPEIVKAFYRGTASYAGSAGFWIGFCFRLGLLLVAAYWTLDTADNGEWWRDRISSSTLQTIKITLARCALAIAVPVGMGTFIWAKPCIDISVVEPTARVDEIDGPARPQLTIFGYANAYGSRYFLMIPALVLTVALLLPPMGQFTIAICAWQILCLLEILDTNALSMTSTSQSSIGPIMLALLGSYHFFKTGHQATLASIQWNSAFVPLHTIRYPWSPLLVILNTFGAQIICAAAVPLTVFWKRPLGKAGVKGLWKDVVNACLTHALYYATIQLATTMWAGHLRRHLMLYRVFMPRYLMASGVLLIVDVVLVVAALAGARVVGLSVGEVFGY